MAIISVQNGTKIYRQGDESVSALINVNLDIEEGEFTVITGTSGSGKTTLLSACAGFIKLTSGRVFYKNKSIGDMSHTELEEYHREKIGVISQSFDLLPMMTAYENIVLPCILAKRRVPEKWFEEIIEICGLKDRLSHFPSELSGGQKQRAAIARALINSPKIILADEPTGNLDSGTSETIIDMLMKINRSGINVFIITHDITTADRIQSEAEKVRRYDMRTGILKRCF